MEGSSFVDNEDELERGLFTRYMTRGGAQTELNINFIPDFLRFLKGKMNSEELLRLEDYHLQNYLMELSVCYKEGRTLKEVTERVLDHIRASNNFWYKHNNKEQLDEEQQQKRHAINCYHRDMDHLKTAFKDQQNAYTFTPTYPRKTPLIHRFILLHGYSEPHFGTRQPLNHISLIPTFILRKRAQTTNKNQIEGKEEGEEVKNPKDADRLVKNLLQECIIFVLSNKSQARSKKQMPQVQKESQNQDYFPSSSIANQGEQAETQKCVMEEFQDYLQGYFNLPKIPKSHHMRTLTYNLIILCQQILLITDQKKTAQVKTEVNSSQGVDDSIKRISLNEEATKILSSLAESQLEEFQANIVSSYFLQLWNQSLQAISQQLREKEEESAKMGKGWLNSSEEIAKVKDQYLQLLDQPEFVELTKYRALGTGVPWKEEDYLKFLKALNEFLNIPTNNKKIASAMGDSFEPNHVKHVKAAYLIVMKERLERGESGGGKRGKCLSKSEFIERDINNFSMRWFQKAKKIYKKKPKRKRRNSSDEQGEDEFDSEY